MGWIKADAIVDPGEIVVRLKQTCNDLPVQFLGWSVHQIAMVTGEGDIYCRGARIKTEWIEGWIPLPPPNWANQ